MGKPLDLSDDEQAGDRWAAFHILSNAKLRPGWAQLRREIDDDRAAIGVGCARTPGGPRAAPISSARCKGGRVARQAEEMGS